MKKILLISFMLVSALITESMAQRTITGTVTDGSEGLPGANVVLKDTSTGTVTDLDGNYKLEIPSGSGETLVFSFIGMVSQEVNIGQRSVIDVSLSSDATQLTEVVVTGSAVGKSKKTLSFAVGSIDSEMMTRVPSASMGAGLQGKVAGLRVNRVSGQPGQGAFFQIRSANSISNGQQPLIIVDGTYLNGSTLADINPEDIEKIEVLKGAAGASLFGSQAANGVIQIFTKRGTGLNPGKTSFTYRGEVGFSEEINRYDLNDKTNLVIDDANGPRPVLGVPSADNIHNTPLPNLQDYQDQVLFRNGMFRSHYLAAQGNSGSTNFLASVQRLEDEGILKSSDGYERNAFRLNLDHRVNKKLDVQMSSMYSTSEQDLLSASSNGPSSFVATTLFLTPIFDLNTPNEEDGSLYDWDIDNTGLGTTNPLYDRANNNRTVNRNRILGNFKVNYDINDWLSANYSVALDRSLNRFEHTINKGFLSTNFTGQFTAFATFDPTNPSVSNGGGIHRTSRVNNSLISRVNLIAQKKFGDFNTAFRASYLYEDLTSEFNEAIGENLNSSDIISLDNAQSNVLAASQDLQTVANSFFLIADIDYLEKYIFSGLVRREESSLFGPEERGNNFFRLSGAYRITEDFDLGPFSEVKVRASIGTAGVRPTFGQRFETVPLVNGSISLNQLTLGNSELKPSFSTEIELGLNATFLDAFNLEFSYANVETEDQILRVPLSGATGANAIWRNAGTIDADIFEVGLNTDIGKLLNLDGLTWNLNITFDKVTQKISKLSVPPYLTGPGIQQSTLFSIAEGESFGTMVGQTFVTSLSQIQEMTDLGTADPFDPAGDVYDVNDYVINEAGYAVRKDQIGTPNELPTKMKDAAGVNTSSKIGDINPDFRMGFANTFGYKGFSLYTLFDWKKGGDVYNMSKQWLFRDLKHAEVSAYPEIGSQFFANSANSLYNVLVANNHFVEDGSFFMLREASLAYDFSKEKLSGILGGGIGGLRLSVIGRNLFTLTNYTGFHPDVTAAPQGENTLSGRTQNNAGSSPSNPGGDPSLFAVDAFNYPVTRTFTFSLQITF